VTPWTPAGSTRVAGVIGEPVRHSLSPLLLNAAFRAAALDWVYVAFPVAEGQARPALDGVRALGIDGLSVTMPHKAAVAALVDQCTPQAAALDAVNCVVNEGGRLVGHNTDGHGFLAGLVADTGFHPAGRRVVVLGAGGAARAVIVALGAAGATEVTVVNRSVERGAAALRLAGDAGQLASTPAHVASAISRADLVVNATPVGMGDSHELPCDGSLLHDAQVVVDLIYQPLLTPLMVEARARGAVATNGLSMLVHQAAAAFELWTGGPAPIAAMRAALDAHMGVGAPDPSPGH
jgi:shikimate dehydrogenase